MSREFTVDDLIPLLGDNMHYIIDTEAVSLYDSSQIRDSSGEIYAVTVAALNPKSPYWTNTGWASTTRP